MWTEERVARLQELTALGFSAGYIANKLGVTRNAVAGKKDRLLVARPRSRQPKFRIKRPRLGMSDYQVAEKIRSKPKLVLLPSANPVEPLKVGFMARKKRQCAWIIDEKGDDGLALYCGHKTHDGRTYCFAHCCMMFTDFVCHQ